VGATLETYWRLINDAERAPAQRFVSECPFASVVGRRYVQGRTERDRTDPNGRKDEVAMPKVLNLRSAHAVALTSAVVAAVLLPAIAISPPHAAGTARAEAVTRSERASTPSQGDQRRQDAVTKRRQISIRGVYGGVPQQIFDRGETLEDYGINAIWIGSSSVTAKLVAELKSRSKTLKVFAEFNTMHEAGYLKEHPDARPIGRDGLVSPPPDGWQGVCPTHPGYRRERMAAFRRVLAVAPIDGVWLDYHHAQASWEQAEPSLPETCFCDRCLSLFEREAHIPLPEATGAVRAKRILQEHKRAWVKWRCDVFTDWAREFREIVDRERPGALLGSFHCPWSEPEFAGALREKLAIDLKAQAKYLDVFSIMPYHARFGHAADPAWISRQTAALGELLGITGEPGERIKIWPIVQLSDWGEKVPVSQVKEILDHGTRAPASGVMVFVWGTLYPQWGKVEAMRQFYRAIRPDA
jgi:hypothetical protein